jgi:hypothetical protein
MVDQLRGPNAAGFAHAPGSLNHAVRANLRQRALDTAINDINAKTDLNIAIESIERAAHRRVTALILAVKAQPVPKK